MRQLFVQCGYFAREDDGLFKEGRVREREMRSMECMLMEAMELSTEVLLLFLTSLHQNPSFSNFWLGFLSMDTCVKGAAGTLRDLVPKLLNKMIIEMKKK